MINKTEAHLILEILNQRSYLSEKQMKILYREQSGFEGERQLLNLLKDNLTVKPMKVYNFRFAIDGSECQIDCLLIFENKCLLIEVKNQKGTYMMKEDGIYLYPGNIKTNNQPFVQLERAKTMLETLFRREKIGLRIEEKVIFTNREFFLYNASPQLKAVYMQTFNRFVDELNRIEDRLTAYHDEILKKMNAYRLENSAFSPLINYEYNELTKGIICLTCKGQMKSINMKNLSCNKCGKSEQTDLALLRSIKEFKLLFPHRKLTVLGIFEWIDEEISKFRIRKVLSEVGKQIGTRRYAYYEIGEDSNQIL